MKTTSCRSWEPTLVQVVKEHLHHGTKRSREVLQNGTRGGFVSCFCTPKFNIALENWWLEDYFPIGKVTFQGVMLNFGRVFFYYPPGNDHIFLFKGSWEDDWFPGEICDRSQEDTEKLQGFELSKHSRLESVTKIEDVSPICHVSSPKGYQV